jgi:putative two-component system response regulator
MESGMSDTPKILIVDDVEANRFTLRDIIRGMGYQPILTENGDQALKIVERVDVCLLLLDVAMPGMDGYEVCRVLKDNARTRSIPIIFISAFDDSKDMVRGFELGGADYITKPFVPEVVRARVAIQMQLYDSAKELLELNRRLQVSISEQLNRIEQEKKNVLYALLRVAREDAAYDEDHMERLSKNCRTLTEAMQLTVEYGDLISDQYVDTIELAAPICDLGNVAIPTEILQKKDDLTEEETRFMHRHTVVGERILNDINSNEQNNGFIQMSREIARNHHENWDGTGYPSGISGDDIPLSAQIVGIVSEFCALTEGRSYRGTYSWEEAFSILEKERGIKYNPKIYDILFKIKRQLC